MAETLQDALKRISRATHQNPEVTALSDFDDTKLLLDFVNEAIQEVSSMIRVDYDVHSSVSIVASTRITALPSGVDRNSIYDWSWRFNDSDGDHSVLRVDSKFIVSSFSDFETAEEDEPTYVYLDGSGLGVYPLLKAGSSPLTLQFVYKGQATRLTALTDAMPFLDNTTERLFVEKYAQFLYEAGKGFGNAGVTMEQVGVYRDRLKAKGAALRPLTMKPYRMMGRKHYG